MKSPTNTQYYKKSEALRDITGDDDDRPRNELIVGWDPVEQWDVKIVNSVYLTMSDSSPPAHQSISVR